ncbi:MAG: twin-arginine translocase subunit TatC [Micrococcales bacterium]|nr:MAG: twin-arginine translocase subunit TatC [Micrococcales bacterium]PIE27405.1 MAG: twin-arginine translocase subunit TatC [Micrococcales bacterium]
MELREHLLELRNRIVKATLGVLAGAVAGWFVYDPVLEALSRPMVEVAHEAGRQVAVNFSGVASAFDLKVRISIFIGMIVSSPVWIYQIWAFITPGLTKQERRYALGFTFTAVPLFLGGATLAYLALQNFVKFLIDFTPKNAANFISAEVYLDFVMRMILTFGLAFLMPVVLVGLNLTGLLSGRVMLKAWRWVVVVAFAFSAMATPTPDVISMFILALPLLLLFFVAIGFSMLNDRRRARRAAAEGLGDLDADTASPL